MLYRIQWSSIAAIQTVSCIEGEYSCIFINENKIEAFFNHHMGRNVWLQLPPYIRERVEARFKPVFAAPPEKRQALMDATPVADIFEPEE